MKRKPVKGEGFVLEIQLTDDQIRYISEMSGIDRRELGRLKLSVQELKELRARHDPDLHDETVGASR